MKNDSNKKLSIKPTKIHFQVRPSVTSSSSFFQDLGGFSKRQSQRAAFSG